MSVVADVVVPADRYLLRRSLATVPEMDLELVGTVGPEPVPYLWAAGDRIGQFVAAVAEEPAINDVQTAIDRQSARHGMAVGPRERLLRLDWDDHHPAIGAPTLDGVVLGGTYAPSTDWVLAVLVPDEDALRTATTEDGYPIEVRQVSGTRTALDRGTYGMTDAQLEAVKEAFESGYFAVPRERTLTAIADDLDVSTNALSARLRRGLSTLVGNTVKRDDSSDPF